MSFCKANTTSQQTAVGIGQAILAAQPDRLTTILGSCVGVAMYAPQQRLGMLGHIVLARSAGATNYPAKFADTAVPHMVSTLVRHGANVGTLVAKIAGGACMFEDCKSMQIGIANVEAVLQALANAGVRIAGQSVGGTFGRRVCFDLTTGSLTVESNGNTLHTI